MKSWHQGWQATYIHPFVEETGHEKGEHAIHGSAMIAPESVIFSPMRSVPDL